MFSAETIFGSFGGCAGIVILIDGVIVVSFPVLFAESKVERICLHGDGI